MWRPQTAAPAALEMMEEWSSTHGVRLVYTRNSRTAHDLWVDKKDHSGERASLVAQARADDRPRTHNAETGDDRALCAAQAVNAHIATHASRFLSPASSMWTFFVWGLMTARHAFRAVPAPTPATHHRARMSHAAVAGAPVTYEKSKANSWLILARAPGHYGHGARSDDAYHELEEPPTSPRDARVMERAERGERPQRGAE